MEFINRIRLMHKMFGDGEGHCKDCSNLCSYTANRKWYKCSVYGESSSEATDWRIGATACGMKNKEWNGNPIYKSVERDKPDEQIDGQLSFEDIIGKAGDDR